MRPKIILYSFPGKAREKNQLIFQKLHLLPITQFYQYPKLQLPNQGYSIAASSSLPHRHRIQTDASTFNPYRAASNTPTSGKGKTVGVRVNLFAQ
jgi:hypothetical protein